MGCLLEYPGRSTCQPPPNACGTSVGGNATPQTSLSRRHPPPHLARQTGCLHRRLCLLRLFPNLHVQYIAAAEQGRDNGALDLLFQELIQHYSHTGHRYFDFGISTEEQGRKLNEGLNFQKEGFGSRTICYDTYSVDLEKLVNL